MPKETKRFINPLLRPSSNVDVPEIKSEPVQIQPEQVQTQPEPQVTPTRTIEDTSTVTSTEMSMSPGREAMPFPTPTLPKASPVLPDTYVAETQPRTDSYITYPSTETSTYQVQAEEQQQSLVREQSVAEMQRRSQVGEQSAMTQKISPEMSRGEDMKRYSSTPSGFVHNTLPDSEAEFGVGYASASPQPAAVVAPPVSSPSPLPYVPLSGQHGSSHLNEETTFASSLPQTSTSTYKEPDRGVAPTSHNEFVEQEYYTPPPVRRRRGAQSFENTHERITVWVDKRLKQAFEELAYTEETSKTALLNEALADLLRKHSSH